MSRYFQRAICKLEFSGVGIEIIIEVQKFEYEIICSIYQRFFFLKMFVRFFSNKPNDCIVFALL